MTACTDKYRLLCPDWVKYHFNEDKADELFGIEQKRSRLLNGKGATLSRVDIEALRYKANSAEEEL
jgi:hypothetical protein